MKLNELLFEKEITWIKEGFSEKGWITVYYRTPEKYPRLLLYSCLVTEEQFETYKTDTDWKLYPGSEGKPSIVSFFQEGNDKVVYQTNSYEGLEPLLFSKSFRFADEADVDYLDIAEEFVLYFQLYETGRDKNNRIFYFIDENGERDEVVKIEPRQVLIKKKYLVEFLSIRRMYLSTGFDFMIIDHETTLSDLGITAFDELHEDERYIFTRLLDEPRSERYVRSWIHGKAFMAYDESKVTTFHFAPERIYESYITGFNDLGEHVLTQCRDTNETAFQLTYFKKEVLNKYLNDPGKHEVNGWTIRSKFFLLKIDNNNEDYVAVFVGDLGVLPHKEQLHWKSFNIGPQGGISKAYYDTMIEGRWVDAPETPDLYFKHKYRQFNDAWEVKFGWRLYKPLAPPDEHYFTSLHIPTTNNVKAFCEQMLASVKITIDRLNEKELSKSIELKPNDKGLTKLEKFLVLNDLSVPSIFTFLRHLQSLRSGFIAHSFSAKNKDCKEAIAYFSLEEKNYTTVARDIFIKSIQTFNTLEQHFNLSSNQKEDEEWK